MVENSKCMIGGRCSLYQDPKWRFGDKCLCNEESRNILGNVFNRGGNSVNHVTNRLNKLIIIYMIHQMSAALTSVPGSLAFRNGIFMYEM